MLTVQEVARLTGFSRQAIGARCQSGKIKAQQDEDGRWWIADEEVERLSARLVDPHYSTSEVAALLSFSYQTIAALLREGERTNMAECPFPNAIKIFGQWRIPEGDLVRLIRESAHTPTVTELLAEAKQAKQRRIDAAAVLHFRGE